MANYANLITQINGYVKQNGSNLITGQGLQTILDNMVASLGANYQYAGVATPATDPGTPDQNVFYIAATAGTYTNFGGIVLAEGEVAVLKGSGSSWTKEVTGIASAEEVSQLGQDVYEIEEEKTPVALTTYTDGYYKSANGNFEADSGRARTTKIQVSEGEKYLVTTKIGASTVIAYIGQWNNGTFVGVPTGFTGGSGDAVDREYIVPANVDEIAICSYNNTLPSLKKVTEIKVRKFYTKEETDDLVQSTVQYGVRWSVTDVEDLGTRCFYAVGKNAVIGVGNTDGSSDFDNIWPWSGMKRCNIKTNANGAKIVTFEGETGFALDGRNGDVFVRIPKFKTDHYTENGYEYIVIGNGYTHPAFIEDGVELDEIFVGAFEASVVSGEMQSKAGVIPANNITPSDFLASAKARGGNYTLADMRSVDAIWRLMAVEYGCRNSNRVFGYGYSDYVQPNSLETNLIATVAALQSNTITIGKPTSNTQRLTFLFRFAPGNNLTICDGLQTNIIAQRKITSVQCASVSDNVVISFDGSPIDITTTMYVGNAPCDCNFCETVGVSTKLNWHTGRAGMNPPSGLGLYAEIMNPCRYRWIENPVGNLWQFLPDVTFNNLQMYVCKSMKDYEMFKVTPPYVPVGGLLPEQSSNGNINDVNTATQPNYWITSLLLDIFAKGNNFGKTFDTVHDGSITSKKGYGGYYYLYSGLRVIVNGGGFDHRWRSNMLTNRAWGDAASRWYLYGARLMFKDIS